MEHGLTILASIVLGVSLAASCGLRAFLPLFVTGVLARLGFVDIGDAFEWLSSGPALLALGVGVVCELLADKVPLINHLLDAIQTPVRALAGMLVCGAVIVDLPTWVVALLALIVGGGVALAMHAAKSALRAGANATTAGAANPVVSFAEDALCAVSTVLSIFFVGVALVIAAIGLLMFAIVAHAVATRRRGHEGPRR